ncbi:hypothetical protein DFP85_12412 [Halomonas ventosae]|uniref:Uncharacterized protein n=1 Tax=Halomonas ventosae TaxID=229007 RepID=A0A4R6ZEF9_9GAMM|nr:hypothetical protein [Halomonas ventosae]TDR50500.1 hypothetical protein DFP85_12412 [Halomonas ventosae]
MAMKPWMSLVAVMVLTMGLAGCGNGDDEPAPAEVEETQEGATESPDETDQQPASGEAPPESQAPAESQSAAPDEAAVGAEEEVDGEGPVDLEGEGEVDTEAETLGATPDDTLDEDEALPGETTRSDVDAIIEETERRFEEASRQIDEQFESAEQEPIELEPMESSPAFESDIGLDESPGSDLDEQQALPGESTSSDIEAILEETEKRFEEASRKIDEQFEEAERQPPGSSSELDALELEDSDGAGTGD